MSTSPTSSSPSPAWQRWLVVLVGTLLALVMVVLGLWQMQVFRTQGERNAEHRAAEPAVPLADRIPRDGEVGDVYGRTVTVTGTYLPHQRVDVVAPDGSRRLLVALRLADGRVLPVVVGVPTSSAPPLPGGEVSEQGIFLPAEAGAEHTVAPGQLGTVRLQELAQRWPQALTPGFVTLDEQHAAAHGLSAAHVTLPSGDGAVRNAGYALQWWVFAAFALGGSLLVARSMRPASDDVAPVASSHEPADPAL